MFDLLIKNGNIADGSGRDAFNADIAIKDGKIVEIGDLSGCDAAKVIDASGKYVTPGFIDPHSHADMSLLAWPRNEAYALQGVTTQICGNCGLSAAPIAEDLWEFWCWEYKCMNKTYKTVFEPYNFQTDKKAMVKALREDYGIEVTWKTLGEFMDIAEKKGFSCNYYPLSGHNHIRNAVMGKEWRPATAEEVKKMKDILRDELEHGSNGLSTGLDYFPGRFAEIEEIEALIRVVAEYGGVYNSHVRGFDPGKPFVKNQVYGVREATELCRRTGVKTNIAHMSPLFDFSPYSEEMEKAAAAASVRELERGWREEGLPIRYDVIANSSAGGSAIPYLMGMLRPWALMCGSVEKLVEMLEYEDFVQMIVEQAQSDKWPLLSETATEGMDFLITGCSSKKFQGRTLAEIQNEHQLATMAEAVIMIVKEDPYAEMSIVISGGEEAVRILLDSSRAMPCSDGFAFDLDSEMDYPKPLNRVPHQNNYCYAIRYLLYYGPKRFEDKIKQMTSVPAEWFNISDRGRLEKGMWADIVVLDRENLRTNEDSVHTGNAPDGIDYVIINGIITVDHKKHTGALAGQVLRRR